MFLNKSIRHYLRELSSEKPVPGGGGTSGLAAALGLGLAIMVGRITLGKLSGNKRTRLAETIREIEKLQRIASQSVDQDPKVYRKVMANYRTLRKARNKAQAQRRVERALEASYRMQADLAKAILRGKKFLPRIGNLAKGSIRNDLIVSSGLMDGAFQGAVATARINAVYLKTEALKHQFECELEQLQNDYRKIKFE